ncbi:MAG TPA: ChaN family lipoprotein [Thermoanaerobaculia bacterium]|nr:ChaN family lipoprotein [Thermoanaerobaculia bacterium]
MRSIPPALLMAIVFSSGILSADVLADHLAANGRPPIDYVLSKLDDHRIVILGEGHWGRRDTELVRSLVPELRRRGVALAVEWLSFESQTRLDGLLAAPAWNPAVATEILRDAHWPYVQYRDILKAAWEANRAQLRMAPLRVLAIGLPSDFREKKLDYDASMAQRVKDYSTDGTKRVLVYCGMHHAFTRYLQVERRDGGRATEFMDRFGNILWRRYAQEAFLIALHKPHWCGPGAEPAATSCPPFAGAIDCAGAALGHAVGFDVIGSPIAEMRFPESSYYAFGHPHLRFVDYTDGYIWSGAVDDLPQVDLIPLAEVRPDDTNSADAVRKWEQRATALAHPLERPSMRTLGSWRDACPTVSP